MLIIVSFVLCVCIWCINGSRIIAPNPIRLSLLRLRRNGNSTTLTEDFRTKPRFFENALDFHSGFPFEVDVNRWNAIVNCGLFSNLSIESFQGADGVFLHLTGVEVESRIISPELSMKASLDKPELSGGISVRDRNFRGLGETLSLLTYFKQESLESKEISLRPNFKIKWIDNTIGKISKLSIGMSDKSSFEFLHNVIPLCKLVLGYDKLKSIFNKVCSRVTSCYFCLEGLFRLPSIDGETDGATGKYGFKPYWKIVEPHNSNINDTDITEKTVKEPFHMIGVKSFVDLVFKTGLKLNMWHDGGVTRIQSSSQISDYRQLGYRLTSPLFSYPVKLSFKNPVKVTQNNQTTEVNEPLIVSDGEVCSRMRLSGMKSFGNARIPLYHHSSMISRGFDMVRGFPSSEGSELNKINSYTMLQSDVYYDTKDWFGKFGVFSDSAVYSSEGEAKTNDKLTGVTTLGLSWRSHGFRIDVGNPINSLFTTPRIHLGIDSGD